MCLRIDSWTDDVPEEDDGYGFARKASRFARVLQQFDERGEEFAYSSRSDLLR